MDLSNLDPNSIKLGFIVGFCVGFVFAVYILDHMYKKCCKEFRNELYNQYKKALETKRKDIQ